MRSSRRWRRRRRSFSTTIDDEMAAVDGVDVTSRQQDVAVGDSSLTDESLVTALDDAGLPGRHAAKVTVVGVFEPTLLTNPITTDLSVIERTREMGLLRAVGLTRSQLRRTVTLESVAISVLGAVLGLVLGLVFGSLLRYALREDLTALALPVGQLTGFLVLAVVVGVLAATVPAIRASRLDVLKAIATE